MAGKYESKTFPVGTSFEKDKFTGAVSFAGSTFEGQVSFDEARFSKSVSFKDVTFEQAAYFTNTTFCGDAFFGGAYFKDDAVFRRAAFDGPAFGRDLFDVAGDLILSEATFKRPVDLIAAAEHVKCDGMTLEAGGQWKLRWAEIDLRRAAFADLLTIAYAHRFGGPDPPELVALCTGGSVEGREDLLDPERWRRRLARTKRPRLLAVEGTNVEHLVLSRVDLWACRFTGARKLDQLQMEDCDLPRTPGWTGRNAIWEEHRWRRQKRPGIWGSTWFKDKNRQRLGAAEPLSDPPRIATLYRALRKGMEDNKDEPGAADFYYGEMEMRRHTRAEGGIGRKLAGWWESRTLYLYWLFSGYALRPFKAFVSLVVLVAIGTALLHQYGFGDLDRPFGPKAAAGDTRRPSPHELPWPPSEIREALSNGDIWIYSASTAAAVVPSPDARLTSTGRGIRAALRVLGPIFVGLTLLSIRGRVKR